MACQVKNKLIAASVQIVRCGRVSILWRHCLTSLASPYPKKKFLQRVRDCVYPGLSTQWHSVAQIYVYSILFPMCMCTQMKEIWSLYMRNIAVKQFFTAMMCTQVRFCVWHATLLLQVIIQGAPISLGTCTNHVWFSTHIYMTVFSRIWYKTSLTNVYHYDGMTDTGRRTSQCVGIKYCEQCRAAKCFAQVHNVGAFSSFADYLTMRQTLRLNFTKQFATVTSHTVTITFYFH